MDMMRKCRCDSRLLPSLNTLQNSDSPNLPLSSRLLCRKVCANSIPVASPPPSCSLLLCFYACFYAGFCIKHISLTSQKSHVFQFQRIIDLFIGLVNFGRQSNTDLYFDKDENGMKINIWRLWSKNVDTNRPKLTNSPVSGTPPIKCI